MIRFIFASFIGLVALTGTAPASEAPPASPGYTPQYHTTPCPFPIPAYATVDCGYLTVPESRSIPDGTHIKLAVAVLRAPASNLQADPIVFLNGGPGGSALHEFLHDAQTFTYYPFRYDRDLIFVDQRGTGYSIPTLNCPELDTVNYPFPEREPELVATLGCRERLMASGVNLRAYNSAESAADLEDLRKALNYGPWNVLSVSYGSRLALTLLRDHPEGARSVVLDSPYPPEADIARADSLGLLDGLRVLLRGCQQNPPCQSAYPDLEGTLMALIGDFSESPRALMVTDFATDGLYEVVVDGRDLIIVLIQAMQNEYTLPLLPRMIHEAALEDYRVLRLVMAEQGYGNDTRPVDGPDLSDSEGLFHSVTCQEEYAFNSLASLGGLILGKAPESLRPILLDEAARQFGICEAWDVGKADPLENQPVESDVPALLLVGAYDAFTPPAFARLAARGLANSFLYIFPGNGHSILLAEDCAIELVQQFLDDPGQAPEAACFAEKTGPAFYLPEDELTY